MSKARTVPGENLSERLSARLASRAKVGQTSEFYHRLGVENPYDTNAPAQEMAENGMFSFLSASAYYRELKSSRHRMMWRIESIRHRPVAGERLRTAGPAFARPRRETVLAAPSLHDLVYVDHDAQVDSEEQDLEATAAFPRSKRRAVTARRPVAARPMARVADKHVPAADSALDKRLNEVLATLRTSTRGDTRRALEQAVRGTGVQRDRALERVVRGVRGPVARSAARRITEARVDADQAPIAVAKARMSNERRSSRSVKGLRPVLRNSPALIALQPENNSVPVQEDAAPLAQLGRSKAQPRAQVHKTPSRRVQSPRSLAASAPVGRSNATQRSYRRVAQSVSARPTAWAAALIRPKRVDADVTVGRGMPAASPSRSRRVSSEPVPRAARRSSAGTSSSLSAAPLAGAATRWLSESLHPERAVGSRAVRSMAGATPVRRTTRLAGAMELPTAVEPVLADETPLNQTASVRSSRRKGRAPRQARASSAVGVSRGLLTVQTREIPPTLRASDRSIASQSPSLSASPVRSLRLRDSAVRAEADNGASMGRRVSARPTQGSVRSHVARPQSAAVLLSPTATATATTDVVESAPRLGSSRPIARTRPVKTQATTRAARRADRLPVTDPRGVASARPDVTAHIKAAPVVATRSGAARRPLEALSRSLPQAQAALPLAPMVARAAGSRSTVARGERTLRPNRGVESRSNVDMVTVTPTLSVVDDEVVAPVARSVRRPRTIKPASVAERAEGTQQIQRAASVNSRMDRKAQAARSVKVTDRSTLVTRATPNDVRAPMTRRASQRMAAGLPTQRRVQAAPNPSSFVHAVQAERALTPDADAAPVRRKAGARRLRTTARMQARGRNTVRVDHRDRARLAVAPTDYLRVAQAAIAPEVTAAQPRRTVRRSSRRRALVENTYASSAQVSTTASARISSRSPAPTARLLGQLNRAVVDLDSQSDFAVRTPTLQRGQRESVVPVERLLGREASAPGRAVTDERVWMQPAELPTSGDEVESTRRLGRSVSRRIRSATPTSDSGRRGANASSPTLIKQAQSPLSTDTSPPGPRAVSRRTPRLSQVLRQVSGAFRASERADVQVLTIDAARRSVRDAPRASAPSVRAVLQADAIGRIIQGRATDLRTGSRSGAVALSPTRSVLAASGGSIADDAVANAAPTSFRRRSTPRHRPVAAAWAERRAAVVSSGSSSVEMNAPGSRIVHRAVSPMAMTLGAGGVSDDTTGDSVAPSLSSRRNLRAGVVGGTSRWTAPFQPNAQHAAGVSTTNRAGRRAVRTSSPFNRVDPSPTGGIRSVAPMAQPIRLDAAQADDALEFGDEFEADSPRRSRRVRKPIGSSVRTSGNLLTALARAGDAEQVVQVILQRSGDLNGLSKSLGGAGVQIARTIAASAAEPQLVEAAPRRSGMGPRRRGLRGSGPRRAGTANHRTPSMNTVQSGSSQGVGSSNVMKLANKLMKLIHLAEHNRRDEARGQVRMAEESSAARAEGGASGGGESLGDGNMSMEALKEQVLQEVQHQIDLMKQRQGDPDVGNGWW